MSEYRLYLPEIENNNPTIIIDAELKQDPQCYQVVFSLTKSFADISNLPKVIYTEKQYHFNIYFNGKLHKK